MGSCIAFGGPWQRWPLSPAHPGPPRPFEKGLGNVAQLGRAPGCCPGPWRWPSPAPWPGVGLGCSLIPAGGPQETQIPALPCWVGGWGGLARKGPDRAQLSLGLLALLGTLFFWPEPAAASACNQLVGYRSYRQAGLQTTLLAQTLVNRAAGTDDLFI